MNPIELRIGNITNKGKVTGIPLGSICSEWQIECDYSDYNTDDVQPIPISEEWLLKFGFERNQSLLFEIKVGFNKLAITQLNTIVLYGTAPKGSSIHICSIQYVHQLQNLYFALTGEEI